MNDVIVRVGDRTLVEGLTAAVRSGEIVCVCGPSGVGKSELLRAVAGLRTLDGGTVTLDGKSAEEVGYPEWRTRVTYMTQRPVMHPGSVLDNLMRPLSFRHVRATVTRDELAARLEHLCLEADVLDQEARSLSPGEQQRIAFVRVVAIEPSVILLDEPTSALDRDSALALEGVLAECIGEGMAAVVVTHDDAQLSRIASATIDLGPRRGS